MTLGEKIQFYRKKIGLPQDELGRKMLVSRQTVSLWEMDKTVPTVDNLLRLKEIFGVSVDDLLSDACPLETAEKGPSEVYEFCYSQSELKEVYKKSRLPIIRNFIFFSVACIFLFVLMCVSDNTSDATIGLILGCFVLGSISHIKGYYLYKKSWKYSSNRIRESIYLYEVYDGYFVLTISRNGEIVRTAKIYYTEIEKRHTFGNYVILQFAGQSYIIKKDILKENSLLVSCDTARSQRIETKNPGSFLKAVSLVLFVASIATIFGAIVATTLISWNINVFVEENMWIFFLFTPIPVTSILFGLYMKKKGYRFRKNIIAGIIMTALLCIYGSFSFIFANIYSHSDKPIIKAEQTLGIDIPEHSQINTQDLTKGTQSGFRGYVFYVSDIYFEESSAEIFEKELPNDPKWISTVPTEMIGITSSHCDMYDFDHLIIYNVDTNQFNKLPSESGTYRFINILYDSDSDAMKLVEYEIEYKE